MAFAEGSQVILETVECCSLSLGERVRVRGKRPSLYLVILSCLFFTVLLSGCESKSAAKRQRNAAYLQGQNAGMVQALQSQGASVTVVGDVKNRVLTWTRDLTVATAFLQADYQGVNDPRGFRVLRGHQQFRIEADELLDGKDFDLEPGDILEIQQ